ncbi:MAG: asparagine synthetase B, partial [Bdellovibrionota bacterium]
MTDVIAHRGPNAEGFWSEEGLFFGHRRLSILDLSPDGAQPMRSNSGRYLTIYNGEVYNFKALRKELEDRGQRFRGHSDTEILLAGFEEWGFEETLCRSTGMFALAVWDFQTKKLLLARDRLGEKPLYYGWQGKSFLFGSELKSFRKHPDFEGRLSMEATALYVQNGCIPAPHSIYEKIFKLAPGTSLEIPLEFLRNRAGTPFQSLAKSYWSPLEAVTRALRNPFQGSETAALDELDRRLQSSVSDQMISDVPLGAFL